MTLEDRHGLRGETGPLPDVRQAGGPAVDTVQNEDYLLAPVVV
jgi:hypothetical protein